MWPEGQTCAASARTVAGATYGSVTDPRYRRQWRRVTSVNITFGALSGCASDFQRFAQYEDARGRVGDERQQTTPAPWRSVADRPLVVSMEVWCADLPLRQCGKGTVLELVLNAALPAIGLWRVCR